MGSNRQVMEVGEQRGLSLFNHHPREGPSGPRNQPSLGWMCRHRQAASGHSVGQCTLSSVVLPRAWQDHSRFRTSANRCAILHPEAHPSDVASPPCPRHADRGCKGQRTSPGRPVASWSWPLSIQARQRTHGWAPGLAASRATIARCDLSAVDLGWARGPSCTYPPGLPFLDAPSSPPWADLSTQTCDPSFFFI